MNDTHDLIQHKTARNAPVGGIGYNDEGEQVPIAEFAYPEEGHDRDSTSISREDLERLINRETVFERHFLSLVTNDAKDMEEIGRRVVLYRYFENPTTQKQLAIELGGISQQQAGNLFRAFVQKHEKNLYWLRSIKSMGS